MGEIEDPIRIDTAVELLKGEKPMAVCPRCQGDQPLISTLKFRGAEFICMQCRGLFGFLAPRPVKVTPELQARHDELREQFLAEE